MAKKNKKKAQMFKNFLAFKAGQSGNNTVVNTKGWLPNQYMVFKDGQSGNTVLNVNKATVVNTSFQTPHGDETLTELLDDNSPCVSNPTTNIAGGGNQASGSGIKSTPAPQASKWTALKPVEDASTSQIKFIKQDKNRPNLTIVEGSASKIQLVIDKSKKTVQGPKEPKPEETPTPMEPDQPYGHKPTKDEIAAMQLKYGMKVSKYPALPADHIAFDRSRPAGIPRVNIFADLPKPVQKPAGKSGPVWVPNTKTAPIKPIWPPIPTGKPNTGVGWPKTMGGKVWPTPDIKPASSDQAKTNSQTKAKSGQGQASSSQPQASSNQPQASNSQPQAIVNQPQASINHPQVNADLPLYEPREQNLQTDLNAEIPQAYSPSDIYDDRKNTEEKATDDDHGSVEEQTGDKRPSAFSRLGPVPPAEKKAKLTINLVCNEDNVVREVVDETDDIPTHLRPELTTSVDPIVVKYLDAWPWRKPLSPLRIATARVSKSVMIMEQEYLDEAYMRDNRYIRVSVTGYPPSWKKEDVLDAVLESVKEKSFIPCFIDFTRTTCTFLVIRSRPALIAIHKFGFVIRLDKVELVITIANINLNLNHLDFVPRLVLRKMMADRLDGRKLDMSEFTTKNDISHMLYFPLARVFSQSEILQLQSTVPWEVLTSLDLSNNRITTLTGFDLLHSTPRLRHLNLSHNCIEKATVLMQIRNLPLKSIVLEGNPLCNDYIEEEHYIKVLTLLFSGLEEIGSVPENGTEPFVCESDSHLAGFFMLRDKQDAFPVDGVSIKKKHDLPDSKRNYCCEEAKPVVDKLLDVMFPLLDAAQEQRFLIEDLYRDDAMLTVTFMYKLHYSPIYRDYRSLFARARVMDEGHMESIDGSASIAKLINRWPDLLHDPDTFTVDVLFHSETTTIVRIGGIVKITAETLAEDEHLLAFTRTLVLYSRDGSQYKITNEMLYWDLPTREYADTAFKITRVKPTNLNIRLEAPPDEELKKKLLAVFMQITELEKRPSERCLEAKNWHIRHALEYFSTLLKLDDLNPIMRDDNIKVNK